MHHQNGGGDIILSILTNMGKGYVKLLINKAVSKILQILCVKFY